MWLDNRMLNININKSKYMIFKVKESTCNYNHFLYLHSCSFNHNSCIINSCNCNLIERARF